RARLLIVPLGLDYVVQSLLGQGMAQGKLALDLARQIVASLKNTLHQESRAANLDIAIDGPTKPSDWVQPHPAAAPGLIPAVSSEVGPKEIHAAGILHGLAGF